MVPRSANYHRLVNGSELVSLGSYVYPSHVYCLFIFTLLCSFSFPNYCFTILAFMISFMDFLIKTSYRVSCYKISVLSLAVDDIHSPNVR